MASTPGLLIPILFNLLLLLGAQAEQCGSQAGGAKCSDNLCCSQYGWCGSTSDYCGTGCQSQCSGSSGSGSGVGSIISSSTFDDFFPSRNSFYTYSSFINAANAFTSFGTSGSSDDKKREIAAFFANVKQETGGLVYIKEISPSSNYCDSSNTQYPCASGKSYYGRGPMQLSWNYNYGAAGSYLGLSLLSNPDLLEQNADDSFKSALWFWTQSPSSSSSCHAAMVGGSGFGKTIKIINGGIECGKGSETTQASNRISYYKSFCSKLGVDPGSNLSCA